MGVGGAVRVRCAGDAVVTTDTAVVAAGGAVGALLRYGAGRLWRNGSDAHAVWRTGEAAFPWTPLVVNVVGCFLMGALIVALAFA